MMASQRQPPTTNCQLILRCPYPQALATGRKTFAELRLALEIRFEGVEGSGMLPVAGALEEVRYGGAYIWWGRLGRGAVRDVGSEKERG